jgi:uncharacterized membrane protein YgcG
MSSPVPRRLLLLSVLAVTAACRRPDSVLLIEVAGPLALQPAQFDVVVTAGLASRSLQVPIQAGGPLTLPVSFSIELDRSRTGPVTITVEAFDASQSMIACGTTMQEHIEIGGQTVISVMLDTVCTTGAGTGGAGGSGGSGGSGGAGGAGGDGGAGAGGESGDDGGLDGGEDSGLDAASD